MLLWRFDWSTPARGGESVSTEMLNRLRGSQRTIERNLLEEKLMERIKANRVSDALAVISNLLNDYKSPEERDLLRGVQAGFKKSEQLNHPLGSFRCDWRDHTDRQPGGSFLSTSQHIRAKTRAVIPQLPAALSARRL